MADRSIPVPQRKNAPDIPRRFNILLSKTVALTAFLDDLDQMRDLRNHTADRRRIL